MTSGLDQRMTTPGGGCFLPDAHVRILDVPLGGFVWAAEFEIPPNLKGTLMNDTVFQYREGAEGDAWERLHQIVSRIYYYQGPKEAVEEPTRVQRDWTLKHPWSTTDPKEGPTNVQG
jgi:hypothetical protein